MDIRDKETGLNISVKLDKFHYKKLIGKIKELGRIYEHKSDVNKLHYSILSNCQKLPYMKVKGWSSRVVDTNKRITHVTFVDYDNTLFWIIFDEISYLTEKYNLPPWYVFSTYEDTDPNGQIYGNYLLYNLKKCNFKEVIEMQDKLCCDQAFKKIPLLYRFKCWCSRLSNKNKRPSPKFKCVIGDTKKVYNQETSNGHLQALNSIYPETKGLIRYANKDKGTIKDVTFVEYITASR